MCDHYIYVICYLYMIELFDERQCCFYLCLNEKWFIVTVSPNHCENLTMENGM